MTLNKQIHLVARPEHEALASHFRLVVSELPPLGPSQVMVRHHYLSLDPYMRGRMSDAKNYAAPQPLGATMLGGTAGEVIASNSPAFAVGDHVVGAGGWQQYSVVDAGQVGTLHKVDVSKIPLSAYLGAVGMPGVTAWYGLTQILQAQVGQTMLISAAAGAVGSAFAALAKARGCHTVGIAGGPEKCAYAVNDLGFDACLDYKLHADAATMSKAVRDVCTDGVDGYFENVGGMVLDAVLPRIKPFGRIAMCGMIAGYDGASLSMQYPALIVSQRLRLQGFIVSDHLALWPQAMQELSALVLAGKLRPRESVAQGLEAAPAAFLGLLKGKNLGKQLVKLV